MNGGISSESHKRRRTALLAGVGMAVLLLGGCVFDSALDNGPKPENISLPANAPRVAGADTAASRDHNALIASFGGDYKSPAVQVILAEIAERLGSSTDKPGLRYQVTILNSPLVNAFALPSGQVYVTRGLLALANDTSEVAAVLAHEIAHVTARHALERETLERRSVLLSRVDGEVLGNSSASEAKKEQGRQTIANFSRQQELEADQIAVRTISKAGYDPYGAARFLNSLGKTSAIRAAMLGAAANSGPDISATHPSTPERIQLSILAARQIGAPGIGAGDRTRWLNAVNGMVFGEDPAQGLVRGRRFLHPRLGFSFSAPENFILENNQQAVIGYGNNGSELLKFDTVRLPPAVPLEKLLETGIIDGVPMTNIEALSVNGLPGAAGIARDKEWTYRIFAIRLGAQVYRMIFATTRFDDGVDARFREAAMSFRRLSPEEALTARPLRIALLTARDGEEFAEMAEKMAVEEDKLRRFQVLNGLEPEDRPVAGQRYKIVAE